MHSAGQTFGVYRLNAPLGQGAYGEVWAATSPHGPVAIKLLKIQEGWARRRFEREAQVLSKLDHPHCVTLIDYGVAPSGTPYIVTELLTGETLANWFVSQPRGTRLEVATQIASAVAHAHALNIVHRDLKPDNVMVVSSMAGPQAKVLDFGLARLVNSAPRDITETGEVLGTPGYMSPEQLRGDPNVGAPTDVYALGAILFLLLEGRPPFEGTTMLDVVMQHLTAPVPPLGPGHRSDVAALVAKMLSKDPHQRPRSAVVVRTLDDRFALGSDSGLSPHVSRQLALEDERRDRLPWPWIAVGGLLVSFVLGALFMRLTSEPEPPRVITIPAAGIRGAVEESAPVRDIPDLGSADSDRGDVGSADLYALPDLPPPLPLPGRKSVGCQLPANQHPGPGEHELDGADLSMVIRIPKSYNPRRPAPVLILIHDIGQRPHEILAAEGIEERADKDGFVIIAPQGSTPMPDFPIIKHLPLKKDWVEPDKALDVIADFRIAAERLCLNQQEVFVLGHGNGGVAAEYVACQMPVRALIMTSHRMWGSMEPCRLNRPVPSLLVSPINDPAAPLDDSPDCFGTTSKWNLEKQEAVFTHRHRCAASQTPVKVDHAECFAPDCQVDLMLCRAEGGRDWKAMRNRKVTSGEEELGIRSFCASPKGDFDYVEFIWSFIDTYRLR